MRLIPARAAALICCSLLLAGCDSLPVNLGAGKEAAAKSPCDQALERMNSWAQAFVRPVPDSDLAAWRQLAATTAQECAPLAGDNSEISRADAALAAAYAVQRQFPQAIEVLQLAPEQNSPEALMVLAGLVGQGLGVEKDPAQAAELIGRAAEIGGNEFKIRAAQEFIAGASVERNLPRAKALFKSAIDAGSTDAMLAYATDYLGLFRRGSAEDAVTEAIGVVERAATENQAGDAMALLAVFHLSERGRSLEQAEVWAKKALESGSDRAFLAEGLVAFTKFNRAVAGQKLEDYSQVPEGVEAAKWFRQGAEVDDFQAAAHLGELYALGVGVPRDRAEAERWLQKARAGGNRYGAALLRRLQANAKESSSS